MSEDGFAVLTQTIYTQQLAIKSIRNTMFRSNKHSTKWY